MCVGAGVTTDFHKSKTSIESVCVEVQGVTTDFHTSKTRVESVCVGVQGVTTDFRRPKNCSLFTLIAASPNDPIFVQISQARQLAPASNF